MRIPMKHLAAAFICSATAPALAAPPPNFVDTAHFAISQPPHAVILDIGGTFQTALAQTMTVEFGGVVEGVFIPFHCGSGAVRVELRDVAAGLPGPNLLGRGQVNASQLPLLLQLKFIYVDLKGGASLPLGAQVSIVVQNPTGVCWYSMAPENTDYAGGNGFYQHSQSGGWQRLDPALYGDDIPFQLVLRP